MSFEFPGWPRADSERTSINSFCQDLLQDAIDSATDLPNFLLGRIKIVEVDLGIVPPKVQIMDLSELSIDRVKGMAGVEYRGDGRVSIECCLLNNTENTHESSTFLTSWWPWSSSSSPPLVRITVSSLVIDALFNISVTLSDLEEEKQTIGPNEGVSIAFLSDPLESVVISTSFDSIPIVNEMARNLVEHLIRWFLNEKLALEIWDMSRKMMKSIPHDLRSMLRSFKNDNQINKEDSND